MIEPYNLAICQAERVVVMSGGVTKIKENMERNLQHYCGLIDWICAGDFLGPTRGGVSLITFGELDIKWPLLLNAARNVVGVFAEYPQLFGPALEGFKESEVDCFFTSEAVKAWFEGSSLPAGTVADKPSEYLLENIIQATLSPFLVSYSKPLLTEINPERWRRRYCPICGGIPDFAFLDKESGARWLLCSRCNAEWLFQRLECPYCGATDQNALSYFTDDKGLYRLYICEQCKRYLKAIDLRQAGAEVSLPLERLATMDIDAQAREQGYRPYGEDSGRSDEK